MATILVLALLLGVVCGLRSMCGPAAIAWAVSLGRLSLSATPLAFFGATTMPWLLTVFALGELVTDKLPFTPSRKILPAFGARLVTGGVSGGAIGAASGQLIPAAVAGVVGAVIGTLGGSQMRASLAAALGRDLPAALIEDAIAVGGTLLVVGLLA